MYARRFVAASGLALAALLPLMASCSRPAPDHAATPAPDHVPMLALTGTRWSIESVDGRPVVDASATELQFTMDGRAVGRTGCNGFAGAVGFNEDGISFGEMVSTRKACEPALMEQENAILAAFGNVRKRVPSGDDAIDLVDSTGVPRLHLRVRLDTP